MKYKLRNNYSTNPMLALNDILTDRGVTDLDNFLHPSKKCELNPYNLDNIDTAAEKLLYHLHNDSNIIMIVDADADGFTSSSILWLYIKNIFPDAKLNFVVHEHKQHGLNDKIDWLEEQNFQLVVVPDAGSFDVEEHKRLNDIGVDCIVLDHHSQLYDDSGNPITSASPNTIIVNNQLSLNYPNKTLCGAGIVYKFCEVLDIKLGIRQAFNYLDLAALGEIADVMDRTDTETNYIIMEGLSHIQNKGLKTLIEAQSYSLKEKAIEPYTGLTAIDIAFYIAPLINALTRVGTIQEKETMFYCFIEPDRMVKSTKRGARFNETETAAEQTARVGKNAKARQDKLKQKAIDLINYKIQKNDLLNNNIIYVELDRDDDVPQELTGLIAMNIVSTYHKPCLIGRRNGKNEISGSARNDGNFEGLPSLKNFLEESGYFEYVAGHDNAFGQCIRADKLNAFLDYANKNLNAKDFENCYTVDYILNAKDNNQELVYALASHPELFGNHIEEIRFVFTNINLNYIQIMGNNKDCIKISSNGIDFIRFKDDNFIDYVVNNRMDTLTVYGRANINNFMGKTSVQCFIDDYEFVTTSEEDKYKF